MKRKIKQNVWGNWYGYEGTCRVKEFANTICHTAEQAAEAWLKYGERKARCSGCGLIRRSSDKLPNFKMTDDYDALDRLDTFHCLDCNIKM